MDVVIRKMERADYEAVTHLYNWFVENSTATFETEPFTTEKFAERLDAICAGYPSYVAMGADGRLCGYCYVHAWKERQAYSKTLEATIYLHPDFHRLGLGRKLMQMVMADCKALGYDSLIACVTGTNSASIALCEALGFRRASHFVGVGRKFGELLDVVDLQLILN